MASNNYITIENLHYKRGDRYIFKGLNLTIERGKVTAIMGPSGCGKTTLLSLIGGQLKPESGTILVDGENIPSLSRKQLMVERRNMGMLFQSGALFTDLSVYENVAFPLRLHTHLPEPLINDLVLMKLQAVGLRGARHLMPAELSGGMARRAALARTIILDPQLLMYDEPFAGQDPIYMGTLKDLIHKLNSALGLTTVLVSHDVPETASIADYIYIIADGGVIGEGKPDELFNSDNALIRQFINGLPDGPIRFHYPAATIADDFMQGGR
jgi:phospholipid/cholesterol/gamma-HCH transport system ATP-binding protein